MLSFAARAARHSVAVCGLIVVALGCRAQVQAYNDRSAFMAALSGHVLLSDDFEPYASGPIALGDRRGDYLYSFDESMTQPGIVPGGNGGQALGGEPFGVLVGGDSVTLSFDPLLSTGGPFLTAFGADFLYAPSFEDVAANTYRLGVEDGTVAGYYAGNLDGLDGAGGTFFLGIIAGQGAHFAQLRIYSVPVDEDTLVPAFQADNLAYAPVPEPGGLSVLALGGAVLLTLSRRHTRRRGVQSQEGHPHEAV